MALLPQLPGHFVRPQLVNPVAVPTFWHTGALPPGRVQHRKRHKVATSCNRCRSNKRKCDGGVPCASCLKKNVDCRYTDAQLSRATWGDSLLSDEKVIGVVADKPRTQLFYTGVCPLIPPQDPRLQTVLHSQSRQHSKAIQVTHPGPYWSSPSVSAAMSEQSRVPFHHHHHHRHGGHQQQPQQQHSVGVGEPSWANRFQEPTLSWTTTTPVGQSQAFSEISSLEHYATKGSHNTDGHHPSHHQIMDNDSDEYIKARKIQRMARDLIDIKRTEFTLLIPRHILHEDDEHFVVQQHFQTNPKRQSIPPRLMMIPRDANFLVEVFFEHAYFYYPVLNRAVVELCLMDSHTPHSMLLLNTVFMVACKHLPRTEDTMRAIEFRERVRELRWYVGYTEDRTRLTALLGEMLGFMAVYGLFGITPGHMEFCATHRTLGRKSSGAVLIDHDAEFLRGEVERGRFAEVPYQNRLWLFWAHYLRDSIAKLYFGYEYGIDAKPMTAELPRIKNFIGLGGGASSPSAQRSESHSVALTTGTTRKRRETSHSRGPYLPDKRFLSDPEAQGGGGAGSDRRPKFRGSDSHCNEETDSSEDEVDGLSQIPVVTGGPNSFTRPISVLSKEILEAQSRGDSALHKSTDSAGSLDPAALTAHMERMEVLLRSQEDATDNGSYARALFLEEIKLWTIGRRLSAYLASRVAGKASPCSAGLMGHTPNDSTPASAFHSTLQGGVGKWSEQEWLQDQELQNLQADLIAWEKAIPEHLRFRQDVDHSDVNHKVNGKVSIIMMSYYTITIMLQTSYLPDLSDMPRSKKSSPQVPPPNQDGPRSRLDSRGETDSATTTPQNRSRSTSSVSKDATTAQLSNNNSNNNNIAQPTSSASSRNTLPLPTAGSATAAVTTDTEDEFFNTAHRICTELSNVLLHHVEIMLDRYPHWCSIQAKVNHALIAAQRVTCLNARFNRNSAAIRDEAKAGFKMGSELYKRLALLPAPLVIHDRPPVEDVKYMNDLEKEFQQMVVGQEEERGRKEQQEHSQSQGVQEEDQSQVQGQDTLLDAFVLEADNQAPPMNDSAIEINPQGLNIFGGEETEGYAFEFETIPVSMKDSFSFLLDPHTLTE